jgi:recombination protein RecA
MQRAEDAKTEAKNGDPKSNDPKHLDPKARAAQTEALDDAILNIEKAYGKGAIMRMGQQPVVPVAGISTGSLTLDLAIGGVGLPRGRIVEIFGPESSGKTTLTLHVVANAQKEGGTAAFIDAEHALDPQYARKLGVDLESLLIAQPDNGEQALDICETLVRSGALDVIVIDSVAALVPKAEIEGEMGDSFVGLHARLMSQALRKLTALTARSRTCLVFINQIREKIGVMFGSPETTTGGRALKFYSSVRLDIRRIGQLKDGEETIGNRTKVTVVKNKIAPPFRKVEFDILFNKGIDQIGEMLDLGVERGALKRSGTWISLGDTRLGQGRERAREFLEQTPDLLAQVRQQVLKVAGAGPFMSAPEGEGKAPAGAQKPGAPMGDKAADKAGDKTAPAPSADASRNRLAAMSATAEASKDKAATARK